MIKKSLQQADKFFAQSLPGFPLLNQSATIFSENTIPPFSASTKVKVNEILIKITDDSPFLSLASPIIQREILHRIYKYLSNGRTLSYEITCKLLSFMIQDIDISKKKKIMQLDKEILAVNMGHYLVFEVDSPTANVIQTEMGDIEIEDKNDLNKEESEGIAENVRQIFYKNVTVTFDEVWDNVIFYKIID